MEDEILKSIGPMVNVADDDERNEAPIQGASWASVLGEAMIDLSDHVDALKTSAVALSLHG